MSKPKLVVDNPKPAVPEEAKPFVSALASMVAQAVVRDMTGRKRLRLRHRTSTPEKPRLRLVEGDG